MSWPQSHYYVAHLNVRTFPSAVNQVDNSSTLTFIGGHGPTPRMAKSSACLFAHSRSYVNQKTSQSQNLSYVDASNRFVLAVDTGPSVPIGGMPPEMGRRTNRIHSTYLMGDGFVIIKVRHIPTGCAYVIHNLPSTWPAFWTATAGAWPEGGEIDIIEGANGQGNNLASMHTTNGCMVSPDVEKAQLGCVNICAHCQRVSARKLLVPTGLLVLLYQEYVWVIIQQKVCGLTNLRGGGYFVMMRDTSLHGAGACIMY